MVASNSARTVASDIFRLPSESEITSGSKLKLSLPLFRIDTLNVDFLGVTFTFLSSKEIGDDEDELAGGSSAGSLAASTWACAGAGDRSWAVSCLPPFLPLASLVFLASALSLLPPPSAVLGADLPKPRMPPNSPPPPLLLAWAGALAGSAWVTTARDATLGLAPDTR